MPDRPPTGRGQLAGLPWWAWAAAGVVAVGGYIYLKDKAAAGSAAGTGTAAGTASSSSPTGLSSDQWLLWLLDQSGTTTKTTKTTTSAGGKTPKPGKKPGKKPKQNRQNSQPPIMSDTYTVKPGQSLLQIAKMFHISRVELAHANGLGTGAGLRTGQKLKVPGPLRTRAQGGPG